MKDKFTQEMARRYGDHLLSINSGEIPAVLVGNPEQTIKVLVEHSSPRPINLIASSYAPWVKAAYVVEGSGE